MIIGRINIRNGITDPADLKRFETAGYRFSEKESEGSTLVFLRSEASAELAKKSG